MTLVIVVTAPLLTTCRLRPQVRKVSNVRTAAKAANPTPICVLAIRGPRTALARMVIGVSSNTVPLRLSLRRITHQQHRKYRACRLSTVGTVTAVMHAISHTRPVRKCTWRTRASQCMKSLTLRAKYRRPHVVRRRKAPGATLSPYPVVIRPRCCAVCLARLSVSLTLVPACSS